MLSLSSWRNDNVEGKKSQRHGRLTPIDRWQYSEPVDHARESRMMPIDYGVSLTGVGTSPVNSGKALPLL